MSIRSERSVTPNSMTLRLLDQPDSEHKHGNTLPAIVHIHANFGMNYDSQLKHSLSTLLYLRAPHPTRTRLHFAIRNHYFWPIFWNNIHAIFFPMQIYAFMREPEIVVLHCKMQSNYDCHILTSARRFLDVTPFRDYKIDSNNSILFKNIPEKFLSRICLTFA